MQHYHTCFDSSLSPEKRNRLKEDTGVVMTAFSIGIDFNGVGVHIHTVNFCPTTFF